MKGIVVPDGPSVHNIVTCLKTSPKHPHVEDAENRNAAA